jgi:hypothetical protein
MGFNGLLQGQVYLFFTTREYSQETENCMILCHDGRKPE